MATTADDVWRLLAELVEAQKETERRFQETERLLREQTQETERLLREQSQETERLLREQSQETERLLKEQAQETDRLLKEEARHLNQQIGKLGNRLGEFVEWQVRPAVLRLFQARGIAVNQLYGELILQDGNDSIEIDLLVVNRDTAILVEVKSKLSQADVNEHLDRIRKFKQLAHQYQSTKILGAVAGMVVPPEVARYAYRQGLFVLAQSGDGVVILNDDKFQPKAW